MRLERQGDRRVLVKGRSRKESVPVESDDPDIEGALRAGADGFILKPFDREIVEAKLQEIGLLEPRPANAVV